MDKDKFKDTVYALVKGGVGAIPLVGAPASELLSVLIAPPLEKRREEWMSDVGERLNTLEEGGKIDLQKLRENDFFVDTIIQATHHALKTSEKEKIAYFKNVIENTALGEFPDKVISQVFLNTLDRYNIWHIKILSLFDDPEEWFKINRVEKPNLMMGGLSAVLETAFPALTGQRALYSLLWAELERDGMHNSGSLQSMISSGGLFVSRTTQFGKQFLAFIKKTPNS